MVDDKLDMDKVKEFLTKQVKDITEPSQVKFRALNKQIKSEFGKSLFIPQLSATMRELRPDLAKPPRGTSGKRRGRKPGPKPGRKAGRKPGPKPGKKYAKRGVRGTMSNREFLVILGRKMFLAKSRDRVQVVIDKLVAAGQGLGRLKVYALSPVGISTRVSLD